MRDPNLNAEWVALNTIEPNPWNPNVQSEFIFEKTVASILEHGFVDPIKVRSIGEHHYEIIDGEHRWKVAKHILERVKRRGKGYYVEYTIGSDSREYKIDRRMAEGNVPIIDYGKVSDAVARELTVVLNNTRGEPDTLKLATLIQILDESFGQVDRERLLPYTPEEQTNMIELLSFNWSQYQSREKEVEDNPKGEQEWENILFSVPEDAVSVVMDEIKRIGKILEINQRLPKEMRYGLILEKICVLSGQTPIESLE